MDQRRALTVIDLLSEMAHVDIDEVVEHLRRLVPHPFDEVRGSRIRRDELERVTPYIDMLEVFNARNALPRFNARAKAYAREHGLLAGAGSDTHSYPEYGRAYIDIPPFSTPQEFLEGARRGTWHGRLSSPLVHARTRYDRTLKVLGLSQ